MPLKILLNGAKGRMGRTIAAAARSEHEVIAVEVDLGDDLAAAMNDCQVVIDFSSHDCTVELVELAVQYGKPVVIGTTGHTGDERAKVTALAEKLPIIWAGNFSVGVNLLNSLTAKAASILSADYDPEVVEMHHRLKVDAPSGTAERLVEIIKQARKPNPSQVRHGRQGITGERSNEEIGVHSLRGGDIVGEHTVIFAGEGERLELTHKATDRRIFARGALRAAHWVIDQPAGLYDMDDVLGLGV